MLNQELKYRLSTILFPDRCSSHDLNTGQLSMEKDGCQKRLNTGQKFLQFSNVSGIWVFRF
jgi:hypothetical protein